MSLNMWINSQDDAATDECDHNTADMEQDHFDTASVLLEIRKDVKSLKSKFDGLSKSVNELKLENKKLIGAE